MRDDWIRTGSEEDSGACPDPLSRHTKTTEGTLACQRAFVALWMALQGAVAASVFGADAEVLKARVPPDQIEEALKSVAKSVSFDPGSHRARQSALPREGILCNLPWQRRERIRRHTRTCRQTSKELHRQSMAKSKNRWRTVVDS